MSWINVGYDASGNNNNWTPINIDQNTSGVNADVLVDVPTNQGTDTGAGGEVRGNYATINPLDLGAGASATLLNNGNLQFGTTADGNAGDGNNVGFRSTMGLTSGKWYIEGTKINATNDHQGFGFGTPTIALGTWNGGSTNSLGSNDQFIGISAETKAFIKSGGTLNATIASGFSYAQGDVFGIALDLDNDQVSFYLNGSQLGSTTGFTRPTGVNTYFVTHSQATTWHYPGWAMNFGQRPFTYTAPSGFKALCTQNLPEPTIVDGGDYFDVATWTGTGSNQTITTGLQTDFLWTKIRSGADNHVLVDAVRGSSARLFSNLTLAESSSPTTIVSLNSDGFTLGTAGAVNGSGSTYVGWGWKANGAGVTNTAGTITGTVTVSANTTAGFSIVTYTGTGSAATVGHGLGAAPSMVIIKDRDSGTNFWVVGTSSLSFTSDNYLRLNATTAVEAGGGVAWNNTAPTSTTVSIGNSTVLNASGNDYVMYCFAPVEGYSAFGSYTGNGSADGPFVYTGFRPAYIIIKNTGGGATSSLQGWPITDTTRSLYNVTADTLFANNSNASSSNSIYALDILSNGFKARGTDGAINESSATYIYMAFAENPFKLSRAR